MDGSKFNWFSRNLPNFLSIYGHSCSREIDLVIYYYRMVLLVYFCSISARRQSAAALIDVFWQQRSPAAEESRCQNTVVHWGGGGIPIHLKCVDEGILPPFVHPMLIVHCPGLCPVYFVTRGIPVCDAMLNKKSL